MTWLDLAADDPFGVHNLPYGAFDPGDGSRRLGARIGGQVLDLAALERVGLVEAHSTLQATTLNPFLALGRPYWTAVRDRLTELLTDPAFRDRIQPLLLPLAEVTPQLPFEVGDYVDFYSSLTHATNLGRLFRPGAEPLLPNWRHLPIGYHGRAGTVVVSGTDIVRPSGQRKPPDADAPTFGPSRCLDIEAEVGFVVGAASSLGRPLTTKDFHEYVFGVVLVNDWSARDLQAWEYQPLGPFLGKSFATSVSAWVVPLDALASARVPAPQQSPLVLPYLADERIGYDIRIEVVWDGTVVSRPPFSGLYWTPAQQLAHLTANGASVRPGDLYASGTVSGRERDQVGSFIELTWGGAEPVTLADGRTRTFVEDGDTVTLTATAPGPDGTVVGFGEVVGRILPAVS
ncbi:fumarylacetoacetase [Planosporangium flavigriseum]|uniref:fumarylacetoacetase n=1 Tax=Planosporangium flavigriseum TaxID=373681 RepID=A0A8J3PNE7_9ACTN|nr:fumarylacetoacetase [Planosporangium flavigriseum]NJC63856.1 fumarylacetoacetase [Planosporangium flavigriseum]GIG75917.1 fumarylacetoacetase [Planosporangium flavigriseum]